MTESNAGLQIKEIKYGSEEYTAELKLRDEVLRKPLGMSLYIENLEGEKQDTHIGAFINNNLVGVLILTKLSSEDIKMRQFAVAEAFRTQKIGTEMVYFAEEYLINNGYTTIVLNARKSAAGFYEKLGYEKISAEFLEINIPHYKMRKCIISE
ncbi:MAG: GNAT family N-acetyltransferase [Paludibacter sp.]